MKLQAHIQRPANFHQPLMTLTYFLRMAEQCLDCAFSAVAVET